MYCEYITLQTGKTQVYITHYKLAKPKYKSMVSWWYHTTAIKMSQLWWRSYMFKKEKKNSHQTLIFLSYLGIKDPSPTIQVWLTLFKILALIGPLSLSPPLLSNSNNYPNAYQNMHCTAFNHAFEQFYLIKGLVLFKHQLSFRWAKRLKTDFKTLSTLAVNLIVYDLYFIPRLYIGFSSK
jgi:hypothetical protein